jgi:hypothetical protein
MSCEIKKPAPSIQVRIDEETRRNIGLSPIFNVNTSVNPCIENFVTPTFWMSGATKPQSGLTITSDSTHNLSEVDNFNIIFNFTGDTMYTGYTGEFCYSVRSTTRIKNIPTLCSSYDSMSGNPVSLVRNFTTVDVASNDSEYFIHPWNKFYSKCISDRVGDYGTKEGIIDTSHYPTDLNDNYFVTVIDPPKPVFTYVPSTIFGDMTFVNERISPEVENARQFRLPSIPVGGVVVLMVNGVTMDTNDYTVDTQTRIITTEQVLRRTDIVQVYYNVTGLVDGAAVPLDDVVKFEMFSVTGITNNVTGITYDNFVNYNPTSNRQEIRTKENIDNSIDPIVTINGVSLTYNVDVFKSTTMANKLTLREGLSVKVGDVISIFYYNTGNNNPGDLGKLITDTPLIRWSTQTNIVRNRVNGSSLIYTIEVADRDDTDYNTIITSATTVYYNDIPDYTLSIGPITTTSITNYRYRIRSNKIFKTYLNNSYETISYSDDGSFSLDWPRINNTN